MISETLRVGAIFARWLRGATPPPNAESWRKAASHRAPWVIRAHLKTVPRDALGGRSFWWRESQGVSTASSVDCDGVGRDDEVDALDDRAAGEGILDIAVLEGSARTRELCQKGPDEGRLLGITGQGSPKFR